MTKRRRILIVGGGASGMLAGIVSARNGAEVTIIEQNNRVGKKLLITGNGRCNLTNLNMNIERFHGSNTKFAVEVLTQFDENATIEFFEDLGIHCIEEDCGKIFPASLQASSVLDALRYEISSLGIEEKCNSVVTSIIPKDNGFHVHLKNGTVLKCDKVILATGGKASPGLGSNGSGYTLAEALGHKIIESFPALVKLKLSTGFLKSVSGVKFIGQAMIKSDGKIVKCESGEILFTDTGISGPPILQLSRFAGELIKNGKSAEIVLDLFPEKTFDELLSLLKKRTSLRDHKPFDFSFIGLINKKLINVVLRESGINDLHIHCKDITNDQLKKTAQRLKTWSIPISGTHSWNEAQVTAGGIDVNEINSKTMESKLVPGLHFAGEIIDIDGDCGGFNLQWAWSSGFVAGNSAL